MKHTLWVSDFFTGLKAFGEPISLVLNSILLALVYFFGIGLTCLLAKFWHKHFLEMTADPTHSTYWTDLHLTKQKLPSYLKQY